MLGRQGVDNGLSISDTALIVTAAGSVLLGENESLNRLPPGVER
jgi:hypothetical protein